MIPSLRKLDISFLRTLLKWAGRATILLIIVSFAIALGYSWEPNPYIGGPNTLLILVGLSVVIQGGLLALNLYERPES